MLQRRIVLSSSYGTRNVGDDAILAVLVAELRDCGCAVDILTFTPDDTARRHPGATAVRSGVLRGSLATFAAIRKADALVVGGGGILQDATSFGNLLLHISRPIMAVMTTTPIAIAAVGVGPLQHWLARRLTRWACYVASSIDVRDVQSARLLAEIGVPDEKVTLGADLAHLLPKHSIDEMDDAGVAAIENLRAMREQGRCLIGLSLRPAVGDAARRTAPSSSDRSHLLTMAEVADSVVESHNAQIVFVSMHPEQDDEIAARLIDMMQNRDRVSIVPGGLAPATIKAAVAELDLLVGTRLHSLIFAACHSVPPVGLAYDDKVAAYLESLGLGSQVLRPGDWQVDNVLQRISATIDASAQLGEHLARAVPPLFAAARDAVGKIHDVARGNC